MAEKRGGDAVHVTLDENQPPLPDARLDDLAAKLIFLGGCSERRGGAMRRTIGIVREAYYIRVQLGAAAGQGRGAEPPTQDEL